MHPNGELIRDGFVAFDKGDMETVSALFDDNITWHSSGTSVLSGDYAGRQAVLGLFGKLQEVTEGTFHQDIHAVLADDDHVVVLTNYGHEKPRPYAGQQVFIWHVRDGKASECWVIPVDQVAASAALA